MVMVLAPEVLCPRRDSTNQEVRDGKGEDRGERGGARSSGEAAGRSRKRTWSNRPTHG